MTAHATPVTLVMAENNVDECNIIGKCDANADCEDTVGSLLTVYEPILMTATLASVTMVSMVIVLTAQILTSVSHTV